MKVVFLVGLPGSGKTHLGQELATEPGAKFFDDASCRGKDLVPFLDLVTNEDGTAIVADVTLCEAAMRPQAEAFIKLWNPQTKFEWIYFENSPDKCRKNVQYRADGRLVEETIRRYEKTYTIPDGVTPRPVWSPEE